MFDPFNAPNQHVVARFEIDLITRFQTGKITARQANIEAIVFEGTENRIVNAIHDQAVFAAEDAHWENKA